MTEQLFGRLEVCRDFGSDSAAMNMAIDEALMESASLPMIRFYYWPSPALSFGYFGKFSDIAMYATHRDLVRRWTGGGIVLHGDDLTYSIVIPANDSVFNEPSVVIYEKIHRALADALNALGEHTVVAELGNHGGIAVSKHGITASGYNCFANPVCADVMMDGRKVAGAAQRRTRRGLLQQGSIQGLNVDPDFPKRFSHHLSAEYREFKVNDQILRRARELARQKYGTGSWLHKR
jgi:lipoate-protein ligase A